MEANLRYMYKHFGFFLPDAEFLDDPEGLIKYLGAKLAIGKVGWVGWVGCLSECLITGGWQRLVGVWCTSTQVC